MKQFTFQNMLRLEANDHDRDTLHSFSMKRGADLRVHADDAEKVLHGAHFDKRLRLDVDKWHGCDARRTVAWEEADYAEAEKADAHPLKKPKR